MAMTTTYPSAARPKAKPVSTTERCCGCGCEKHVCTCCDLTCFERPDYHCGHLLTDADLSLQVRYVVEKNKLRNRTLHGHGVVCGLKMTCDTNCCGHILVHDGYAIDPCGNDIVVCETACFDVMSALRGKHLIAKAQERDPCKPGVEEKECRVPQCFYVTICYKEEDADYETPFQSGCSSGPQACAPTRIKERYTLDVTDCLPDDCSYLDRLEEKLKHCFRLFLDSPVGRLMTKEIELLKMIAEGKAQASDGQDRFCQLFCLLKAHFQQQLKQYPDELSCDLAKEVACLACPEEKGDKYASAMQDAFAKLLKLMHRYQYDCVLADLVFSCEAPKEGECIVLGCVEVDDCCVLRVSNTHRKYVWSFANILPILMSTALTSKMQGMAKASDAEITWRRENTCCDDFVDFDHRAFLAEFEANPAGRYLSATSPMRAMRAMHKSIGDSFAFTESTAFAADLLAKTDLKDISRYAEVLGLNLTRGGATSELAPFNPLQAFLAQSLMRANDTLRVYPGTQDTLRAITPDFAKEVTPERRGSGDAGNTTDDRDATIAEMKSSIADLQARLARLEPNPSTSPRTDRPPR
jgi:hypothetical protein